MSLFVHAKTSSLVHSLQTKLVKQLLDTLAGPKEESSPSFIRTQSPSHHPPGFLSFPYLKTLKHIFGEVEALNAMEHNLADHTLECT